MRMTIIVSYLNDCTNPDIKVNMIIQQEVLRRELRKSRRIEYNIDVTDLLSVSRSKDFPNTI